jgi:hypothetical protein
MVTTIQLSEGVKMALDRMKEISKETYEEVIVRMMNELEREKREKKDLLVEGYKEMTESNLKILKEFELIENELDWEWN